MHRAGRMYRKERLRTRASHARGPKSAPRRAVRNYRPTFYSSLTYREHRGNTRGKISDVFRRREILKPRPANVFRRRPREALLRGDSFES
jgi:hypothetical protein